MEKHKKEVTISADRLSVILAFAMNEVCEAHNLDDSYVEFAADMHSEAFGYIFGDRQIPEEFEEICTELSGKIENLILREMEKEGK